MFALALKDARCVASQFYKFYSILFFECVSMFLVSAGKHKPHTKLSVIQIVLDTQTCIITLCTICLVRCFQHLEVFKYIYIYFF